MSDKTTSGVPRRHDLDALRAFAMLLGILLHAVLSLTGNPWIARDSHPAKWLEWVQSAIHGFRMPLFIFVSGYFTMMLWRRRGLAAMVDQRYQRVFIPCILGVVSILPVFHWMLVKINTPAGGPGEAVQKPKTVNKSPVVEAVRAKNTDRLRELLAAGESATKQDEEFGIPPLSWAAMLGDANAAELLLNVGADVNAKDKSGYRALHSAMFQGRPEVVELLLRRGADPLARGPSNDTPRDSTKADWETTKAISGFLKVPLGTKEDLEAGRARCVELISGYDGEGTAGKPVLPDEGRQRIRKSYVEFLLDERFSVRFGATPTQLFLTGQFDHLWFLWFLCWLVAVFALGAWIVGRLPLPRLPRWISLSPVRFLWLIPITMVPQVFMGIFSPDFGPDTSIGLLPQPHLLAYYGIFFFAGAFCQDHDGEGSRLGRFWWLMLPLALAVALPAGKLIKSEPMLSGVFQVTYAWAMSFGLIGLFRAVLNSESRVIRYLSDSAYWLYVAHLPVVVALQHQVKDWDWPAELKLAYICGVSTIGLLLSYQLLVRHFWLGRLLNGPRHKHKVPAPETPAG